MKNILFCLFFLTSAVLQAAERWDPDQLMKLYKRAGAKYFVSMGTHHDNFFLWNSKINRWNSVNMGPKKDVDISKNNGSLEA